MSKAPEYYRITDKIYDPESGHGSLECVKRTDGKFDLVIYGDKDDLTLYGLTPRELAEAGRMMEYIAASVDPESILLRPREFKA